MNAWKGTILRIDLASGVIRKEALNMKDAQDYVGARGLASKYLVDEVDPMVDPLSPDNKLIMMTGPPDRHCRRFRRKIRGRRESAADGNDRRRQLRRLLRPGAEIRGL